MNEIKGRYAHLLRLVYMSLALVFTPIMLKAKPPYAEQRSLASDIADAYVKSFPSEKINEKGSQKDWDVRSIRPPKLGDKVTREVIFNGIYTKSNSYRSLQQRMAAILNEYSWADLNLFYGTTSEPAYHLMGRINRTITTLGEGALATILVTPTSDIKVLRERQKIVQAFLRDDVSVKALRDNLRKYQDAEQSLFSLWTDMDPLYTKEYRKYMNEYFYYGRNKAT
ncbi:MAG: hypothetical protein AAFP93_03205, partial [Bacteroidota bacterium]